MLAKDTIKPRLEAVTGVADVGIAGGQERELQVKVDPAKLRAKNVTFTQVSTVLSRET